jgi:iron complex transport system permease protein
MNQILQSYGSGELWLAEVPAPALRVGGAIVRSALSYVPFLHVQQPLGVVDHAVIWQLRAPRVALAALVGGMLAVAGTSYQGVFRNPLCDPYLLGVAGGAGLGATLAIVYASAAATGSTWTVPLAAFAGAIAAVVVTYLKGVLDRVKWIKKRYPAVQVVGG